MHFTPTPGSWLNLVEVFFEIIARQVISAATSRPSPTWKTTPRQRHTTSRTQRCREWRSAPRQR
jgi:hypothetical protein